MHLLPLLLLSVKNLIKIIFYIISALYPIVIFTSLVIFKLPVRIISLCVIGLALAFFLSATGLKKNAGFNARPIITSLLFMTAGLACFLTNRIIFLRLYAVVISLMMLLVFSSTLIYPPSIIFRFACLADKTIKGSPIEKKVMLYCKKVCMVWCLFFVINGSISFYTAFFASEEVWAVYNGGISYLFMGLLFAIEYIIRIGVNKKMKKNFPISKFTASSFEDDRIISFEGKWSDKKYKTWHDFLVETAKMRRYIQSRNSKSEKWILHCEDYWLFTIAFVSLLQCKKTVLLTQNITEGFLKEIHTEGIEFLTDQKAADSTDIQMILYSEPDPAENDIRNLPVIDSDQTKIIMFTSGSTGKPKGVEQRMTEFEMDNAFIISKWGDEFLCRKLVATVSQHHIYGFLFTISLPFTLGIPVRRKRIEFPEEFETLDDDRYMIIATPAFLKRTIEIEEKLPLSDSFIFTSGGLLTYDIAEKSSEVFGFWPVEVYGSTETSGIAWRRSKDGQEWTPFDNAKIWLGDDGCLRIISPYIKSPEGFATADLAQILPDGRFLLNGRSDSIVKIEEKRISMTEVENRLLDSGLVADVKVVAMEDRRQYLAAAMELNKAGKEKFKDCKKLDINRYFHDYLMQYFENVVIPKKWRFLDKLPADVQGKKHKEEIKALFNS